MLDKLYQACGEPRGVYGLQEPPDIERVLILDSVTGTGAVDDLVDLGHEWRRRPNDRHDGDE